MSDIEKILSFISAPLPVGATEKLTEFCALLGKWNKVYNLTAIRDQRKIISHHIADSLSILSFINGNRSIDIGSGGGLPGIPLAIVKPDHHFTLLDSNVKKTSFLTQAKIDLQLTNVEVIHSRVEDFSGQFTNLLTRGFSSLQQMIALCEHLREESGQFLAMKGVVPEQEILALPANFQVQIETLTIPNLAERRCLCIVTS